MNSSKTLVTVQKISKFFKIVNQIGEYACFISAGFVLAGLVLWCVMGGENSESGIMGKIFDQMNAGSFYATLGELIAAAISCLTAGALSVYSVRYFRNELEAGTPFTFEGAAELKKLGIKMIVIPIVAFTVCSIIYSAFGATPDVDDGNGATFATGIAMLIIAQILKSGAELMGKRDNTEFLE